LITVVNMTLAEIPAHQFHSAASARRPGTFKNVLVGVDGTSTGRDAIALAETLRDPDGRLILAHVVLTQGLTYSDFHSTPRGKDVRAMLDREREAMGVSAELTGTFAPSVPFGLHQLAEDRGADLLVVGSCSRGLVGRVLVGDNARGAVTGATCPVAVAPHGWAWRSRPIEQRRCATNDNS
jgi:nucleotide-binding universal stress UspA family protein